ncbi:MAG: TonB-dependent receptor [Bacteroidota bacterium]
MTRVFLFGLLLLASAAHAQAEFEYSSASLREVIEDVEDRTDWRFLYRDALVARAEVRLSASSSTLPDALARALAPQGIAVDADPERRQILLASAPRVSTPSSVVPVAATPEPSRRVRGRVVDAETGEPLPFATVTWDGARRGVVCDVDGSFSLDLKGDAARQRTELTASFAGYEPASSAPSGPTVTFRLRSPRLSPTAIVIAAPLLDSNLDPEWAAITQRAGGVGEGGGLRALEALPAVAPSPLFSDGLIVRGSSADAFEVRLDGLPIYNPRHLFGLADAFNLDALRAVALHYGVPPARSAAPPGGTLEYVTSAGSLRQTQVQGGVSSLGVRATVEGPLRPGRTSALVSGRISTLGTAPWAVGEDLVAIGLGAETRTSELPPGTAELFDRVLQVTETSARFGDLHLALADEGKTGRRTQATVYLGGDRTTLRSLRTQLSSDDERRRVEQVPVETRNRWGSAALGIDDTRPLGAGWILSSHVGVTAYGARFEADDYTFRLARQAGEILVDTLGYDNALREGVWSHQLDASLGSGLLTVGADAHLYRVEYNEQARNRVFGREQEAQRLDLHAAWAGPVSGLTADVGVRGHLYSETTSVRIAPRIRLTAPLGASATASVGFGRSHQFVHRLTLGDAPAAAAWVLSTSGEPPTEADHLEGALNVDLGLASVHLAAYDKRTRNLREHIESRSVRDNLREAAVLELPWLPDVDSHARGVEAMVRAPVGSVTFGGVYALSRTDLQHPDLADGAPIRADWDRRHRATLTVDLDAGHGFTAGAAWTLASGEPNGLAALAGEDDTLPPIQRIDLRVAYSRLVGASRVTASVSVRNALNRDIVIERDRFLLLRRGITLEDRLPATSLDVYDVGVLPSFDLAVGF